MCCPPNNAYGGAPSIYGPSRAEAQAAARRYLAEKREREAAQANDSASESSKRASGSDQDDDSLHAVSEKAPQVSVDKSMKPRRSLGSRCRQTLRKCLA